MAKSIENKDAFLVDLAWFIQQATESYKHYQKEMHIVDETLLPTAMDLARQFGVDIELIKKHLKPLSQAELIQVINTSPKRYRFDHYAFSHLTPQTPLYTLFYPES